MTLATMNERFRVIEDLWKVGSAQEQEHYLAELTDMRQELGKVRGAEADGALWLKRTVDRLSRNITVAQTQI